MVRLFAGALVGATTLVLLASIPGAAADDRDVHGTGGGNGNAPSVVITGTSVVPAAFGLAPPPDEDGPAWEYEWLLSCPTNLPGRPMTDCIRAQACPRERDSLWVLWARPLGKRGSAIDGWQVLTVTCLGDRPPEVVQPVLTPGHVLEAVRRVGLPSVQVQVQPETATLVNFDTIFYAEPQPFEGTVQVLGFDVDVLAEPSSYRWVFGDGAVATTHRPGAPYPAKDITHRYVDAHVSVAPRVDVTYQVQFRVSGGAWRSLEETLTAQGPPTALQIKEATPVLASG